MSSIGRRADLAGRRVVDVEAADLDDELAVLAVRTSMSGSPKTVKRLPVPVFLRSSSPIARSGFMRAWRIGEAAQRARPPRRRGGRRRSRRRRGGRRTSRPPWRRRGSSSGPTVPNSGPMAIATRLGLPALGVLPYALEPGAGVRVEALERRGARPRLVFWTPARRRLSRMLATKRPASTGAGRLGGLGSSGPSARTRWGDRLSTVNGPRHADDLLVLVGAVEQGLGLGVAGDRGVDLLARHALADVRVLGDRLQGHVRHALVHEAAADVVAGGRERAGGAWPVTSASLRMPASRVGEEVVRVLRGHQARASEGERDAAGVDRDPASAPLLGDVGGRAGSARWVEHEVAGVGRHQQAPLDDLACRSGRRRSCRSPNCPSDRVDPDVVERRTPGSRRGTVTYPSVLPDGDDSSRSDEPLHAHLGSSSSAPGDGGSTRRQLELELERPRELWL